MEYILLFGFIWLTFWIEKYEKKRMLKKLKNKDWFYYKTNII